MIVDYSGAADARQTWELVNLEIVFLYLPHAVQHDPIRSKDVHDAQFPLKAPLQKRLRLLLSVMQ